MYRRYRFLYPLGSIVDKTRSFLLDRSPADSSARVDIYRLIVVYLFYILGGVIGLGFVLGIQIKVLLAVITAVVYLVGLNLERSDKEFYDDLSGVPAGFTIVAVLYLLTFVMGFTQ